MILSRRSAVKLGAGAVAAAASPWVAELQAKPSSVKIGITDWNLRKEVNIEAVELAKTIGFDGVEVSLGVGTDRLPLADPELQQRYVAESKRQNLPLASTCLNILHRNYLKSDPLGKRWVADSIPITKALGAHVILLPFFGNGAIKARA